MGQEIDCEVRIGEVTSRARVQLESESLIVRVKPSRIFPFSEMQSVVVDGDFLSIESTQANIRLHLGGKAEVWAEKIRNPKSVMDRIGVKATDIVSVLGLGNDPFVADLERRAQLVLRDRVHKGSSLIFLRLETEADLEKIESLAKSLTGDGAIWILRPKGKTGVPETETMRAGKAAGLVDVKVVKFSELLSAEKFVIPVKKR
ncbi:MAG TPA: hypothetical protein VNM92_18960 [Thermoanaerobaculia bacterium]|nr:hypothetical protein [Thermoanaerobaculia bacterium]